MAYYLLRMEALTQIDVKDLVDPRLVRDKREEVVYGLSGYPVPLGQRTETNGRCPSGDGFQFVGKRDIVPGYILFDAVAGDSVILSSTSTCTVPVG